MAVTLRESIKWLKKNNERFARILKRYPLKKHLGSGLYKDVYSSGEFAILICHQDVDQLNEELEILKILKSMSINVPKIYKIFTFYEYDAAIIVMKRYSELKRRYRKTAKEQCELAAIKLQRNKMYIVDLQFLMDEDIVVFCDPLEVDYDCYDVQDFCSGNVYFDF